MTVSPPLNPILMLLEGNGSLAGRDRAGAFTATGSGALRYAPAPGARINAFANPSFEGGDISFLTTDPPSTRAISTDRARTGTQSLKIVSGTNGPVSAFTQASSKLYQATRGDLHAATAMVSYYVWNASSGDRTFRSRVQDINGGDTVVSPGGWARISSSAPVPAGSACVFHVGYCVDAQSGDVWYVDDVLVEYDAPLGTFFHGGVGGAVWLDPRTGQLGTPHASPSVSRAQFWVEEATTNVLTNPSFEIAYSGHWIAYGGGINVLTNVTTQAFLGTGSIRCEHDGSVAGQGITTHSSNRPAVSVGQTWTASVRVRGSGTIALLLVERDGGGAGVGQSTQAITLTSAWQYVTLTRTLAGVGVATLETRLSTSSGTVIDMYVDCWQLEQKAYATSYCDGSLGTGYTWAGTAHASASTRTLVRISAASANRILTTDGSFVARIQPHIGVVGSNRVMQAGSYASSPGDSIVLYLSSAVFIRLQTYSNGADGGNSSSPAAIILNGSWYTIVGKWTPTLLEGGHLSGAKTTGARTQAPEGFVATVQQNIDLMTAAGSVNNRQNGLIGPAIVYDSALSTTRETMVKAAIDSNGATDLWTLFEEWEGVLSPLDVNVTSQTVAATAGASAILQPLDVFALGTGSATAGASAIIQPLDIDMGDGTVKGYGARPSRYLVIPSPPDIDLDIPNEQDAP